MADANTRPAFYAPFPNGTRLSVKSYRGHNPDDKKMDIYTPNWPDVTACAPGFVHEWFEPGGLEVRHFIPGTNILGNWYTVYLHMTNRVPVGTYVGQNGRLGTPGSVGTGAKHLHLEQLLDHSPNGDADTGDMVYPAFVEVNSGKPFTVPYTGGSVDFVSRNGGGAPVTPPTKPSGGGTPLHPADNRHLYQGMPIPALIRQGTGQYYGLLSGPNESHGGANADERVKVKYIQQRLMVCGFVPGHTNPSDGWADGIFEQATADAVTRFQRKYMPGTTFFGQVWFDDWQKLFSI